MGQLRSHPFRQATCQEVHRAFEHNWCKNWPMDSDSMCQIRGRLDSHQAAGLPRAPSKKPMNALTLALGKRLDVCRAHSSDG